ncbi:Rv0361 family membrane protein [Nocardia sp. NBC_01327]|uniref:Rv0361 family membrane protein n=1 Tax=Nocardia sp. NBC_01327 TaxID=2903593 RepID=UPI002E143F1A|nr:hypothetical protein OG326_16290 [Nocardia sp. NBC_01327]
MGDSNSTAGEGEHLEAEAVVAALIAAHNRGDHALAVESSCGALRSELEQIPAEVFAEQARRDLERRGAGMLWGVVSITLTPPRGSLTAFIRYTTEPDKKGDRYLFILEKTDSWRVCDRPVPQADMRR